MANIPVNFSFNTNSNFNSNVNFSNQGMQMPKVKFDRSVLILIGSNLLTIVWALLENWDLTQIMWVYWLQSVIIGGFNFVRILSLKQFTTENFKINNRTAEPTEATKRKTAFFFLFHYGFFHLVYLTFIAQKGLPENLLPFLILGISFFVNHLMSYREHREEATKEVPNIGTMMFMPYVRILPMHLTIIFGQVFNPAGVLLFMFLKTVADVAMHLYEHRIKPTVQQAPVLSQPPAPQTAA